MILGTSIYGTFLSKFEYKKLMPLGLFIGYTGLALYQILFVKNYLSDIGISDKVSLCFSSLFFGTALTGFYILPLTALQT